MVSKIYKSKYCLVYTNKSINLGNEVLRGDGDGREESKEGPSPLKRGGGRPSLKKIKFLFFRIE